MCKNENFLLKLKKWHKISFCQFFAEMTPFSRFYRVSSRDKILVPNPKMINYEQNGDEMVTEERRNGDKNQMTGFFGHNFLKMHII